MEYTIKKLSDLAGISTRTLRYYDKLGLLRPLRTDHNGYRIYGPHEVDALQQILFYRELGMKLSDIKEAVSDPGFQRDKALKEHLEELMQQRNRLDLLIENVKKTIKKEEGEYEMTDKEKFEGLKRQMIQDNEEKYGAEIREKYGEKAVEESNRLMESMTKEDYEKMKDTEEELKKLLKIAVENNEAPDGENGRKAAVLHKQWLSYTWKQYSYAAHRGLVQMYLADDRFKQYYDADAAGCAQFLKAAVEANEAVLG